MTNLLAVIYPVRQTPTHNILERIEFIDSGGDRPNDVEIHIVDDGSAPQVSRLIEKKCSTLGYFYYRLDSTDRPPNMSRARNYGAMLADTKYILIHDIDLLLYDGYFVDVRNDILTSDISEYANDFLAYPVIYLTEKGSNLLIESSDPKRDSFLIRNHLLMDEQSDLVESYAAVSSVNVFNRRHYLNMGGYDEEFEYWGLEDSEVAHRFIRKNHKYPKPRFFDWTFRQDLRHQCLYVGWKSNFRLYGDEGLLKGVVLHHAHHPRENTEHRNAVGVANNFQRFRSKIKEKRTPTPLPNLTVVNEYSGEVLRSIPPTIHTDGSRPENHLSMFRLDFEEGGRLRLRQERSDRKIQMDSILFDRYRMSLLLLFGYTRTLKSYLWEFLEYVGVKKRN